LGNELKSNPAETSLELGLEVVRKGEIKTSLVICMGHAPAEVGHRNPNSASGLEDAVNFPHHGKHIMEVFENMADLN
jgi:hypothetical protein